MVPPRREQGGRQTQGNLGMHSVVRRALENEERRRWSSAKRMSGAGGPKKHDRIQRPCGSRGTFRGCRDAGPYRSIGSRTAFPHSVHDPS